jgi:hypothetical protein
LDTHVSIQVVSAMSFIHQNCISRVLRSCPLVPCRGGKRTSTAQGIGPLCRPSKFSIDFRWQRLAGGSACSDCACHLRSLQRSPFHGPIAALALRFGIAGPSPLRKLRIGRGSLVQIRVESAVPRDHHGVREQRCLPRSLSSRRKLLDLCPDCSAVFVLSRSRMRLHPSRPRYARPHGGSGQVTTAPSPSQC